MMNHNFRKHCRPYSVLLPIDTIIYEQTCVGLSGGRRETSFYTSSPSDQTASNGVLVALH